MCERVDGELVICARARRRLAELAEPVQAPLLPLGLPGRAEPDGDRPHPWDLAEPPDR